MNLNALKRLVTRGEGQKLEFKRSTGELREALHTVCAFLNADGGKVLFGVRPDGTLMGQKSQTRPCVILLKPWKVLSPRPASRPSVSA